MVRSAATGLAARARSERIGDGMPLNRVAVLGQLIRHGAMTPGEIARRLRTTPQGLTRTFAALTDSGHLRRTADPVDGRQSLLDITPEGRRALRAEMAPRDAWMQRAMAALLSADERTTVLAAAPLLARLADFEAFPGQVEA